MQFGQSTPMGAVDEETVDVHSCRSDKYYKADYGYPHESVRHFVCVHSCRFCLINTHEVP